MEDYKTLTLEEYRALLVDCPRPTDDQIDAFLEYFVESYSWYKHLPLLPQRRAFSFYLDPAAGYMIMGEMEGNIEVREKGADSFGLATVDVLQYYANWSHTSAVCSADSIPDNRKKPIVDNFHKPHIYTLTGVAYCLPTEILEAGFVQLDRLINLYSAQECYISDLLGEGIDWSNEVGGNDLLERIRNRLRVIEREGIINNIPDPELLNLVTPIMELQVAEIKTALYKVRALIDG